MSSSIPSTPASTSSYKVLHFSKSSGAVLLGNGIAYDFLYYNSNVQAPRLRVNNFNTTSHPNFRLYSNAYYNGAPYIEYANIQAQSGIENLVFTQHIGIYNGNIWGTYNYIGPGANFTEGRNVDEDIIYMATDDNKVIQYTPNGTPYWYFDIQVFIYPRLEGTFNATMLQSEFLSYNTNNEITPAILQSVLQNITYYPNPNRTTNVQAFTALPVQYVNMNNITVSDLNTSYDVIFSIIPGNGIDTISYKATITIYDDQPALSINELLPHIDFGNEFQDKGAYYQYFNNEGVLISGTVFNSENYNNTILQNTGSFTLTYNVNNTTFDTSATTILTVADTTSPTIFTSSYLNIQYVSIGSTFEELGGYQSTDKGRGSVIYPNVQTNTNVNGDGSTTETSGSWQIVYPDGLVVGQDVPSSTGSYIVNIRYTDPLGNVSVTVERTVVVTHPDFNVSTPAGSDGSNANILELFVENIVSSTESTPNTDFYLEPSATDPSNTDPPNTQPGNQLGPLFESKFTPEKYPIVNLGFHQRLSDGFYYPFSGLFYPVDSVLEIPSSDKRVHLYSESYDANTQKWWNISLNNNELFYYFTTASTATPPSVVTNDGSFNYIRGSVASSISMSYIQQTSASFFAYTLVHVTRYDPSSSNNLRIISDVSGVTDYFSGHNNGNKGVAFKNNTYISQTGENYGSYWVLSIEYGEKDGSNIITYYKSRSNNTSSNWITSTASSSFSDIQIGINTSGRSYPTSSDFQIAELIIYYRVLTSTELAQVQNYLVKKYVR